MFPITDYVLRHADRLGDKPAWSMGRPAATLTYRQLRDGVRRVAAGLAKRGFKKGRRPRDLQPQPAVAGLLGRPCLSLAPYVQGDTSPRAG